MVSTIKRLKYKLINKIYKNNFTIIFYQISDINFYSSSSSINLNIKDISVSLSLSSDDIVIYYFN